MTVLWWYSKYIWKIRQHLLRCIFCFQNQTPVWESGIAYMQLCTFSFHIVNFVDKRFKGLIQFLMRGNITTAFSKMYLVLVSFQVIWQWGMYACERSSLLVKWDAPLVLGEIREASVPCLDRLHMTLKKLCPNFVYIYNPLLSKGHFEDKCVTEYDILWYYSDCSHRNTQRKRILVINPIVMEGF